MSSKRTSLSTYAASTTRSRLGPNSPCQPPPTIAYVCAISLILHPAIVWALGSMAGLSTGQFRSAVLTAAMAPGVNTYVFANIYGVAKRVAASAVLLATGLSIGTTWVWLTLLQ